MTFDPSSFSRPTESLNEWQAEEDLSADKLNQTVRAVQRLTNGCPFPRQVKPYQPAGSELVPTTARLVLTDSTIAITGTPTIDGVTPSIGDYVLRFCGDTTDGLYQITGAGWTRVGKLNSTDGTDTKVPVYDLGTVIAVYDGNSAPVQYMVKPSTLGGL